MCATEDFGNRQSSGPPTSSDGRMCGIGTVLDTLLKLLHTKIDFCPVISFEQLFQY